MKKLILISSLLAAGTLSAFATTYTVGSSTESGTIASGSTSVPTTFTLTTGSTSTDITTANITSADTISIEGTVTGYFPYWGETSTTTGFLANIDIAENASITINNGSSDNVQAFAGAFTGSGTFTFVADNNPAKWANYVFFGDMSQWAGTISRTVAAYDDGETADLDQAKTQGIIQFGGTSGKLNTAGYAASSSNISGTSASVIETSSILWYNFAGASATDKTLSIDNKLVTARWLEFKGGANYTVNSTVVGYDSVAANNTLKIDEGTVTFAGTVSNFGTITVAENAMLSVAKGGNLVLDSSMTIANLTTESGAILTLGGAATDAVGLTISGTANISTGTIFDISEIAVGTQLISNLALTDASGFGIANLSENGVLVNQRGTATFTVSNGVLSLATYTAGGSLSLIWDGTDGVNSYGVWSHNGVGWYVASDSHCTFQDGDSVTFGASGMANSKVTLDGDVTVGSMTVEGLGYTFTGTGTISVAGANVTIGTGGSIIIDKNVTLDLGTIGGTNAGSLTLPLSGTGTVKIANGYDGHATTVNLSANFTGTVDWTGKLNTGNSLVSSASLVILSQDSSGKGSLWHDTTSETSTNYHFKTNYHIGDTGWTTNNVGMNLTLSGNLSAEAGTTITIGHTGATYTGPTVTFSGASIQLDTLAVGDSGTTFNLSGTKSTISTLSQTNGTTNITKGTNEISKITKTGGVVNIEGGTNTITSIAQSGGSMTISGGTNTIGTITQTGGSGITISGGDNTITTMTLNTSPVSFTGGETTIGTFNGASNIDTTPTYTIDSGATVNATRFILRYERAGSATLDVSGALNVSGELSVARDGNGVININNGGKVSAGTIGFGQNWSGDTKSASITVNSGGTLIAGSGGLCTGTFTNVNSQTLTLSGGTLGTSADAMSVTNVAITLTENTTSKIDTQKDGTTGTGSTITINSNISGDGSLEKIGAGTLIFEGTANAYTGETHIKEGILRVTSTGTIGSGKIVIEGGQLQLGYANSATVSVSAVNINLNSYVYESEMPASSSGDTLVAAIGGNASSSLSFTGSSTTIELSALDLVASSAAEQSYYVVDTALASQFTAKSFSLDETLLNAGYSILDYDTSLGVITLAIPEPSMFGLLAGALALGLAGTRRRRKSSK